VSDSRDYDVIIVGAGLIGSVLALSLVNKTDLKVAVIERASASINNVEVNQRVVALGYVASELLDHAGVLQQLGSKYCHPYTQMFIWDEHSNGELSFSSSEQQQERLGYIVDSARCVWLLQQAMRAAVDIDVHYETEFDQLLFGSKFASLARGDESIEAPLIVAADGANSWLRQQAKIFANHRSYYQRGIVACIETSKPHNDTAWQRFLNTGPLAVLPLADNKSSIVWSADEERAEQIMGLSDEEFEKILREALQSKLGDVSLLSKRQAFPLQSLQADSYFKQHIVLVGDAAHSIHPLAGQGANLGFKDVQSLVDTLIGALEMGLDKAEIGSLEVLQKYQRARKADNQQTDFLMTALHTAYRSRAPLWQMARGIGMNWVSANALIKRALVKQAMGL